MSEKEKAIARYTECNFLIVYGHQHQIQQAYSDGWDGLLHHLQSLSVREAIEFITKPKEEKK